MKFNSQTVTDLTSNKMSQPYYLFDGSDDYIDITSVSNSSVGVRDLTVGYVEALFRTGNTPSGMHVVCFGSTTGNTRNHMICTNGSSQLYVDLEIGNVRKYSGAGSTTLQSNTTYHVLFVHNGTTPKLYLNGVEETITFSITVDKTVWNDSNSNWNMGSICSHRSAGDARGYYEAEAVYRVRFGNHVPSDAEIKELYSGASVPYKYKGANQTDLVTNGTFTGDTGWTHATNSSITGDELVFNSVANNHYTYQDTSNIVKGKRYRITYTVTNVSGEFRWVIGAGAALGAARTTDNTYTEEYTSTVTTSRVGILSGGTTSGNVDNFSITQIGAVAEYDGSGATGATWYDKSGNNLDGTVSGAS